jgi:uncharacterized protein YdeI (YjbR/CyaY-like superfamily)
MDAADNPTHGSDGLPFATPSDWHGWLAANHDSATEVWVLYWRKASRQPSINWQEAVVEALCWGWIDGIRKSVDDQRFKQRFTPRRKGSIWSQINCAHAERLISEGRMQPPGLRAVEMAKANGQWDRAYGGGMASTEVPAELRNALAASPEATRAWEVLDAKTRYAMCFRVQMPKRADTRLRKADEMMDLLVRSERPWA